MERMDTLQAKDKKVSPKDGKAYGSKDPFQYQGRIGRTPVAVEIKTGKNFQDERAHRRTSRSYQSDA